MVPYKTLKNLPESVKYALPKHALEIYRAAFNNAWEEYADPQARNNGLSREETAFRVAWAAVKKVYTKTENGEWIRRTQQ